MDQKINTNPSRKEANRGNRLQQDLQKQQARHHRAHRKRSRGNIRADGTVDSCGIREGDARIRRRVRIVSVGRDVRSRRGGISTFNLDGRDERVKVASGFIISVIPVDHTTSPVDGSLRLTRNSCRPNTQLYPSRGGWVVSYAIRADSVGFLDGADDLSVDGPRESVGLPVDGVVMIVAEGIADAAGSVTSSLVRDDSFPKEIGLSLSCFSSGEFPIYLILYTRHCYKCSDDTTPSAGLETCGDCSVVYVSSGGNTSSTASLGQSEGEFTATGICIDDLTLVYGPIILGGVPSVVGRVGQNATEICKVVLLALANRVGHARIDGVGIEGVTSSKTERSGTAITIFTAAWGAGRTETGCVTGCSLCSDQRSSKER